MTTNDTRTVTLLDVENALLGLEVWYTRSGQRWAEAEPQSPEQATLYITLASERMRGASDLAHVRGLLDKACRGILALADDNGREDSPC